jgi:hypothetical protein
VSPMACVDVVRGGVEDCQAAAKSPVRTVFAYVRESVRGSKGCQVAVEPPVRTLPCGTPGGIGPGPRPFEQEMLNPSRNL